MNKKKKLEISDETVAEALRIAKATQQSGQDKDTTRLIAKGIEKGIAQFKASEKARKRERDKQTKKRALQDHIAPHENAPQSEVKNDVMGAPCCPLSTRALAAIGVIAIAALPVLWAYKDALLQAICL